MSASDCVLIIDSDPECDAALRERLEAAGLSVETTSDSFSAIQKLKSDRHCAVVLDLMIRRPLNGYAVLSYIEIEQPELLERMFLCTAMPRETIARTAPALLPRWFRKTCDSETLVAAIIDALNEDVVMPEAGGELPAMHR